MTHITRFLLSAFVLSWLASPVSAVTLFVDNVNGSDGFDGRAPRPTGDEGGPVRTIKRALELAHGSTIIVIGNKGRLYRESFSLSGGKHSGEPFAPLTIIGNGSIVTGALPVPRDAWHKISAKLWMFRPFRKGHYQLLLGDQPVPEHPVPAGATALPEIPDDHWCAWKGAIYFQAASGLDDIPARPYEFAVGGVGLSLYAVRNVRVEDITFRHFRVDGVNAQDLARNVVLSNVQCLQNGRAGVAISGTSEVIMTRCRAAGNRVNSVRVSEYGALQLKETDVDQPPEILDPPND